MIQWLGQAVSPIDLVIISLVIFLGAALQGSVGFGMALVASPFLIMVEPRLIPGPFLLASQLLSVLIVRREWRSVDLTDIKWAIVGRIPGTIMAGILLALIVQETMVLLFAVLVLVAVVMSVVGLRFAPKRGNLIVAGTLSGLMGTIATLGGPPMALIFQDEPGQKLRPTLSGFFIFGASLALVTLIVVGKFGVHELWLSFTLMPGITVGYLTSSHLLPLLKQKYTKRAVLIVAAAAAVGVIVRQLSS